MNSMEVGAPSVLFTSVSRTLHRFSVSGMFQDAIIAVVLVWGFADGF